MARLKENKPTADVLMNSMRVMGYSFEAAIADIVDNSVSAQAKNIILKFPIGPADCCVAVCDDGIGMSKVEEYYLEPVLNGMYYFRKDGRQVKPIKCTLFNEEEIFRISTSVQIMKRLFKNLDRSHAVQQAYSEFVEEAKKPNSENPYERAEVDRRFRAFIFEWKLYTEHWKNYIYDLDESVYLDEFVAGYKDLYNKLMDAAYKDEKFLTAHVIRNYASHANEVVTHSHIGDENEYYIGRDHLVKFLNANIEKTNGSRRKQQLEDQKNAIVAHEEYINLETVAKDAMEYIRQIETALMNYQMEPQTIQATLILTDAKRRIDDAGMESEIWELLSPVPFMMIDHSSYQTLDLKAVIDGKEVSQTIFRERLNWIGYQAIMDYLKQIVARAETQQN